MTRPRRHPAQASRIVIAGLSTATMLGIMAVLGAAPQDGAAPSAPARAVLPASSTDQPGAASPPTTTLAPAWRLRSDQAWAPHTRTGPS